MSEQSIATVDHKATLEKIAVPALPPEIVKMQQIAVKNAQDLEIKTAEDYQFSFVMRQGLATNIRVIEGLLAPGIADLHQAHRRATAHRNQALAPLQAADDIVLKKRMVYDREQERLAREEEDRKRAAAVQEQQAKALEAAAEIEKAGDAEGAKAVMEEALAAPPPPIVVRPDIPKMAGAVKTTTWKFRVKDEALVPREYLMLDESKIGRVVRALEDKTNIPGIEAYPHRGESVRR